MSSRWLILLGVLSLLAGELNPGACPFRVQGESVPGYWHASMADGERYGTAADAIPPVSGLLELESESPLHARHVKTISPARASTTAASSAALLLRPLPPRLKLF